MLRNKARATFWDCTQHELPEGSAEPTDFLIQTLEVDAQLATLPNQWSEVTKLIEASTLIAQMQPLVDWLPN